MTRTAPVALALALALAPAAAVAVDVGVAAAVNPEAVGTSAERGTRTLMLGTDLAFGERITTGAQGQTQVLFRDESALTVGPNSDVTIDAFVYDPEAGTGRLAVGAAKGVLRFVGGRISKRAAVEIATPTATVGIRGGIALVEVAPDGATTTYFVFGDRMTVTTPGGNIRTLERAGFKVVAAPEGSLSAPVPAAPEEIGALFGSMEGSEGRNGGAKEVPTQAAIPKVRVVRLGNDGRRDGPADAPARPVARETSVLPELDGRLNLRNRPLDGRTGTKLGGWGMDVDLGGLDLVHLPETGMATLTGSVVGMVWDGGALRTPSGGTVQMDVNYGARSGLLTINFDGRTLVGTGADDGRLHDTPLGSYSGTIQDSLDPARAGRAGGIIYSFREGTRTVVETIGGFEVDNNLGYRAEGAFVASDR